MWVTADVSVGVSMRDRIAVWRGPDPNDPNKTLEWQNIVMNAIIPDSLRSQALSLTDIQTTYVGRELWTDPSNNAVDQDWYIIIIDPSLHDPMSLRNVSFPVFTGNKVHFCGAETGYPYGSVELETQ